MTSTHNLDRYRLLGNSGLRVSPICLGTMTFGEQWGTGIDKNESLKIFDCYVSLGGNFIDTANFYTEGTSESWLGEFLEGRRDSIVLGTKYSLNMRRGDPNAGGGHRKSLVQALEGSLKRLRTDYIDLYWLHVDDGVTPLEEIMRALDDVVRAGKVLYVGVSDLPAWKVASCNTLATLRGFSPFVALQVLYNLLERDVERELIPMAEAFGLGVTPWSPLAAGLLTGKYLNTSVSQLRESGQTRRNISQDKLTAKSQEIVTYLAKIASELNSPPTAVALSWLLSRPGVVSPIVGARSVEQLKESLCALSTSIPQEYLTDLTNRSAIELGFPHDFLNRPLMQDRITGGTSISR